MCRVGTEVDHAVLVDGSSLRRLHAGLDSKWIAQP